MSRRDSPPSRKFCIVEYDGTTREVSNKADSPSGEYSLIEPHLTILKVPIYAINANTWLETPGLTKYYSPIKRTVPPQNAGL